MQRENGGTQPKQILPSFRENWWRQSGGSSKSQGGVRGVREKAATRKEEDVDRTNVLATGGDGGQAQKSAGARVQKMRAPRELGVPRRCWCGSKRCPRRKRGGRDGGGGY